MKNALSSRKCRFFLLIFSISLFLFCACGSASVSTNDADSSLHIYTEQESSAFGQLIPAESTDMSSNDKSSTESSYMSSVDSSDSNLESPTPEPTPEPTPSKQETVYVLNTSSMKIHNTWCSSVKDIKPSNYKETTESIDELEQKGYVKCKQKGDW